MSIGCWPLHLSNQLMCRNFVPNHNFKTKGGHTSVKHFQGGSVLHFTDQVDAQPRSANLSTVAINVESHTRFFSAQKGSSPLVVSEIHNQSQQGSFPHNNNLLVTPVRVSILKQFLEGYDSYLATFVCEGFEQGFHLEYKGPRIPRCCSNLQSVRQHADIAFEKLQKEISMNGIAGPFVVPPFKNLQCSPIGLVPKKGVNEFRLIHHLSYPEGSSINDFIPDDLCSVFYTTVDDAISIIKTMGRECLLAKTDIASGFRILPVHPDDHELLGIQFQDRFYYDKCLPMGCSISCSKFESFSTALEWIACKKFGIPRMVHILDDFLFIGPPNSSICDSSLKQFISICDVYNPQV